ncbi:sigma-54-dependent transcriptional regulator [Alkalilimnicola ehrlichii MLHE-1]|uniref:Two component, sigma54 specific, transcriptional regulator, Fis family n=1 Tax=Alkalilimnicola ehrlichii (strain ATCC BAA-1101 / DSM 17681 / MLHE-1) TaxID=187272 RepID=Q0A8W1_ALKEH|nr:sigma-54 dependent transcriptional regulator [Alkalilimnicola ehrlichii]ABI56726.1 two component, sigma54 specific, transcriptional regulator, Fis family [Alkalilimnicola ehrlichii MLHE-1]
MSRTDIASQRILLVEDDQGLRDLLHEEFEDSGAQVQAVAAAEQAAPLLLAWEPDLVVSDLRLPGADGMALLAQARELHVPPAFLIITAFGSIDQAVEALKAGADEFLTKPLDLEHLMLCVNRLLDTRRLRGEVQRFRKLLDEPEFHGMVGNSRAMRVLCDQIKRLARGTGPVLILGESGSGKELVARAIHQESERAAAPFQAVNCAGIPSELLESEFFGHEAGAFTGAQRAHKGLFRQADGGTLFLDEIGEMPLALQAKLLRVLQDGVIRPVGGQRDYAVDVRVVCATHRDIEERVAEGSFREDLFYRLETFTLQVPPLRDREGDAELLAMRFLSRFAARLGREEITGFSGEALQRLRAYDYPGNIRELENAVERAVTFCDGSEIRTEHLPARMRAAGPAGVRTGEGDGAPGVTGEHILQQLVSGGPVLPTLQELERRYIDYVLAQVDGNKRRAAAILDIGRRTLYRRLETGD